MGEIERYQREEVEDLQRMLQSFGYTPIKLGTRMTPELSTQILQHHRQYHIQHDQEREQWYRKQSVAKHKLLANGNADGHASLAMQVTQTVFNSQNIQRGKFMEDIKHALSEQLQVKKDWQQLIQQQTHER